VNKLFLLFLAVMVIAVVSLVGCSTDAEIASQNISKSADQFEIYRRVVFYNGITDTYMLVIEGYCSIDLWRPGIFCVTVKTAPGTYLRHCLGLSDNVTYFAEQIEPAKVSDAQYRVIFKPSAIIPAIELH
jgi:hypothetical protein